MSKPQHKEPEALRVGRRRPGDEPLTRLRDAISIRELKRVLRRESLGVATINSRRSDRRHMKFLVELVPPAEAKNEFELNPEQQEQVGKAIEAMKPLTAWFTLRYGFFVGEAESGQALAKKVAPLFHLFKTDLKISPAYSLEEFPGLVASIGKEAEKYL